MQMRMLLLVVVLVARQAPSASASGSAAARPAALTGAAGAASTAVVTVDTSTPIGRTASGHVGLVFDGYTTDQHDPYRTAAWAHSNWVEANFSDPVLRSWVAALAQASGGDLVIRAGLGLQLARAACTRAACLRCTKAARSPSQSCAASDHRLTPRAFICFVFKRNQLPG